MQNFIRDKQNQNQNQNQKSNSLLNSLTINKKKLKLVMAYGVEYEPLFNFYLPHDKYQKIHICQSITTGLPIYCSVIIQEINIQDIIDKITFIQDEQYKLFQTMHKFLMAFSCKTPPKWQLCLYSCDLYNDYLMVKKQKQLTTEYYSCIPEVILC